VAAYREAVKERRRQRVPLDWAMTQNNLGNALRTLGEREGGTARLEEAVTACRDALKEYTRERGAARLGGDPEQSRQRASTLGEREGGTARLEEAVAAYQHSLEAYEGAGASYYVEAVRGSLTRAEQLLAERRG
jgi:hypothetical protein